MEKLTEPKIDLDADFRSVCARMAQRWRGGISEVVYSQCTPTMQRLLSKGKPVPWPKSF